MAALPGATDPPFPSEGLECCADYANEVRRRLQETYNRNSDLLVLREGGISSLPHRIDVIGHSLVKLDVSFNPITYLPDSIVLMTGLKILNCSQSRLKELPENIGRLHNLKELHVTGGDIEALPPTIGDLVSLEVFDCNANEIQSLPETLGNLMSLKKFRCTDNYLKALPFALGNIPMLKRLDCYHNPLQAGEPRTIEALRARWEEVRPYTKNARSTG